MLMMLQVILFTQNIQHGENSECIVSVKLVATSRNPSAENTEQDGQSDSYQDASTKTCSPPSDLGSVGAGSGQGPADAEDLPLVPQGGQPDFHGEGAGLAERHKPDQRVQCDSQELLGQDEHSGAQFD